MLWAQFHHGSLHAAWGWHWILPMEKTLDPGTVHLVGWWGPSLLSKCTVADSRQHLTKDPCGEGLGLCPVALTEQLNHNHIWKFKIKTKQGKLVNFMRSLEGETATVWGLCTRVSSNCALLYTTLSQESHYSHVLYPTLAVMFTALQAYERNCDSFICVLLTPVLPLYWYVAHTH